MMRFFRVPAPYVIVGATTIGVIGVVASVIGMRVPVDGWRTRTNRIRFYAVSLWFPGPRM